MRSRAAIAIVATSVACHSLQLGPARLGARAARQATFARQARGYRRAPVRAATGGEQQVRKRDGPAPRVAKVGDEKSEL